MPWFLFQVMDFLSFIVLQTEPATTMSLNSVTLYFEWKTSEFYPIFNSNCLILFCIIYRTSQFTRKRAVCSIGFSTSGGLLVWPVSLKASWVWKQKKFRKQKSNLSKVRVSVAIPRVECSIGTGMVTAAAGTEFKEGTYIFSPPNILWLKNIVIAQISLPRYCQGIREVQWCKVSCVWQNLDTIPMYLTNSVMI